MRYYTTYGPGSRPDDGALRAAWQPDSKRWGWGWGVGGARGGEPGAGAGPGGEAGLGRPQQWTGRGGMVATSSSRRRGGERGWYGRGGITLWAGCSGARCRARGRD